MPGIFIGQNGYSAPDAWDWFSQQFVFALLHKYPLFIGSLERSDRAESGISRTFEKKYFFGKLRRKEKSDFGDPIYGYLM